MKLISSKIDRKLFGQYSLGSDLANQEVVAKIFNPYGKGTWYLINSDPDDPDYIWAIVDLFEVEVGSVSREDLETIKVPPFNLNLEIDQHWTPKNALEVFNGLKSGEKFAYGGMTEGNYAKGGAMEHGLKVGDTIQQDLFWDKSVLVQNSKDHKTALVDLEHGKRKEYKYEHGGSISTFKFGSHEYVNNYSLTDEDFKDLVIATIDLNSEIKTHQKYARQILASLKSKYPEDFEVAQGYIKSKITKKYFGGGDMGYSTYGEDPISSAKTKAFDSVDWDKELRAFAGSNYSKMTKEEKEETIAELQREWQRRFNYAKGGSVETPVYEEGIIISKPYLSGETYGDFSTTYYRIDNKFDKDFYITSFSKGEFGRTKKEAKELADEMYDYLKIAKTKKELEVLAETYAEIFRMKEQEKQRQEILKKPRTITPKGRSVVFLGKGFNGVYGYEWIDIPKEYSDIVSPILHVRKKATPSFLDAWIDSLTETAELNMKTKNMGSGGSVKWQDVEVGDSALVIASNNLGLIVHSYGRKFNLKFPDGTEKTYDASELKFISNKEYEIGGGVSYPDLSKDKPVVINDSAGEIPVIDIVKKGEVKLPSKIEIKGSNDAVEVMRKVYGQELQTYEKFYVIMLNNKNLPIYIYEHSKGGLTGTVADVNLIMAAANKVLAKGMILVHNHPSGMLNPSAADLNITKKIRQAGELFDINVFDHIILTKDGYTSLAEEGKMEMGGHLYAKGGGVNKDYSVQMVKSQAKEAEHHAKELKKGLKGQTHAEPWIIAKMERATTDLSDVTHYIDGKTEYAEGGSLDKRVKTIKESDIQVGRTFKLINGDEIVITRLFKENMDEDWVEYIYKGTKEENSVNSLKNFINTWRPYAYANGGAMGKQEWVAIYQNRIKPNEQRVLSVFANSKDEAIIEAEFSKINNQIPNAFELIEIYTYSGNLPMDSWKTNLEQFEVDAKQLSRSYGVVYVIKRTNGEYVNVPSDELNDEIKSSNGQIIAKYVRGIKEYAKGGHVNYQNHRKISFKHGGAVNKKKSREVYYLLNNGDYLKGTLSHDGNEFIQSEETYDNTRQPKFYVGHNNEKVLTELPSATPYQVQSKVADRIGARQISGIAKALKDDKKSGQLQFVIVEASKFGKSITPSPKNQKIDFRGYQIEISNIKFLSKQSEQSDEKDGYDSYLYQADFKISKSPAKIYAGGGGVEGKYGYIAIYKGKQMQVYANSSYEAQQKAAKAFKAKKSYDVSVYLVEKDGEQVNTKTDFAKGGGIDFHSRSREVINYEIILTQNKPNGATWRGIVRPVMLDAIEKNQYRGTKKRYNIDIVETVERMPSKEEIKRLNDFFLIIRDSYAEGGRFDSSSDEGYSSKRELNRDFKRIIQAEKQLTYFESQPNTLLGRKVKIKLPDESKEFKTKVTAEYANMIKGSGKYNKLYEKQYIVEVFREGGMATFDDKVRAISNRLEGTRVKGKYRKQYGATYDKAEAKEAATKIAGKMRAKERAKVLLKKRKK